ncbi:DNA cytosine methyltransferase [Yokenella regensburgei]|uniref:DNA cytosine methyltransferase n=1 Tax=Yokenella regensburgei TaxID=158877 RepID=UPI0031D51620
MSEAIRYGSVCSGIEAASVAWESLGWMPAWFSQFDPEHNYKNGPDFPSAVLAYHWPEVVNLGDMTKIAAGIRGGLIEAPDVLVGGTPCQAFSIAGLRNGLSDGRGQLTLAFVELVNAIDEKRREQGKPPVIVVWENVPGVLSSKDNAFGCFLAGLAGESGELESPGQKWSNAGYVLGPERAIAWRVLDAQFFRVAQRRRRVFVVASARGGFDPAAIFFESQSLRRHSPPRREAGAPVTALTARGVGTCGADDNQGQAGHLIATSVSGNISHTLKAEGFDGSEDGTGRGTPIIAFGGGNTSGNIDVAACLTAHGHRIDFEVETFAVHGTQDPDVKNDLAHTLGRNHGQENAVCYGFKAGQGSKARSIGWSPEQSPTLTAGTSGSNLAPAIALPPVSTMTTQMQVRRLTPRECERLQGFPDDHTLIPYGRTIRPEKLEADYAKYLMRGGKLSFEDCAGAAADGHRYRAIGNSMAVPVMHWIGCRIAEVLRA